MFLVLLSHFLESFPNPNAFHALLGDIAEVASPTFMLISGALVGFLYRVRPDAFPHLRTKLIDRGLFLLTIGHLLLLGGHFAMTPTLRWLPITDAVGVSILITPWIVSKTPPAFRLLASVGLYAAGWVVAALWHPGAVGTIVKETFVGSQHLTFYAYVFPLLPWFCVDLAATVLGEKLCAFHVRGDSAGLRAISEPIVGWWCHRLARGRGGTQGDLQLLAGTFRGSLISRSPCVRCISVFHRVRSISCFTHRSACCC